MNINAFSKFSSPWMGSRGVSWYLQWENGEARPPMARLTGQTTAFNYISEDLVMIQRNYLSATVLRASCSRRTMRRTPSSRSEIRSLISLSVPFRQLLHQLVKVFCCISIQRVSAIEFCRETIIVEQSKRSVYFVNTSV